MQTNFTPAQLADPDTAGGKILRTCVHCGFCTATCPTFLLLGDELDSPRGRIYLIKDMLEGGKPATEQVVLPCRSLPVLPVLHDHLPVGRELHAPGRPCRAPIIDDLPPALAGTRAAPCFAPCCRIRGGSAPRSARRWRGLSRGWSAGTSRPAQRLRADARLAPGAVPRAVG